VRKMAISIPSAMFKTDLEVKELNTSDIDIKLYNTKLKGNLYCTTSNCKARLVFVKGNKKSSYFKTHPFENHSSDCIYRFDRVAGRTGISTEQTINVTLSKERKSRALKEAFLQSKLTEKELENIRESRRARRGKRAQTTGKKPGTAINIVTNPDEDTISETSTGKRGPNILKRSTDTITESDINKHRLLTGSIKRFSSSKTNVSIELIGKNNKVFIKFEEAFFANSPNYSGLFHLIDRLMKDYPNVIFTGLGEVRRAKSEDAYELVIYNGEDFSLQGRSLISISAHYSRQNEH
jgi:hypothetical protein